jgi:peptidoglycan/LPS O-acetylase OafA/YrhL
MNRIYKYNNFYFYFIAGGLISIINVTRSSRYSIHLPAFCCLSSFFHNIFYSLVPVRSIRIVSPFPSCHQHAVVSLLADYPVFIIKNRLLTYLGRISYGIYMYHPIVITGWILVVQHTGIPYFISNGAYILIFTVCAILLTLFIAHLSHSIRNPILQTP